MWEQDNKEDICLTMLSTSHLRKKRIINEINKILLKNLIKNKNFYLKKNCRNNLKN